MGLKHWGSDAGECRRGQTLGSADAGTLNHWKAPTLEAHAMGSLDTATAGLKPCGNQKLGKPANRGSNVRGA